MRIRVVNHLRSVCFPISSLCGVFALRRGTVAVLFEALSKDIFGATKRDIMMSAELYRKRAAEFRAMACFAENRGVAAEWLKLADWYVRLAEQADENSKLDLSLEVGPPARLADDEKDSSG